MALFYCFQILIFISKIACIGTLIWVFVVPIPQQFMGFSHAEKLFVIFPTVTGKKLIENQDPQLAHFRFKWHIFFIAVLMLIGLSFGQSLYAHSQYFREDIMQDLRK